MWTDYNVFTQWFSLGNATSDTMTMFWCYIWTMQYSAWPWFLYYILEQCHFRRDICVARLICAIYAYCVLVCKICPSCASCSSTQNIPPCNIGVHFYIVRCFIFNSQFDRSKRVSMGSTALLSNYFLGARINHLYIKNRYIWGGMT